MLSPGTTFAGYEVESVVGAGGLGILYRARQLRLDRTVALKLVESDVAQHPVVRERLRREARAVAALDHPNVVPLYEAGEQDGTVYIVTRWVNGTELGTLVHRDGRLAPQRAARIAAQIAAALEVAHEKGLTPAQAKRLVGNTREELEADADEVLRDFPVTPATPPTKPGPKPDPSQGPKGDPPARAKSLTEAIAAQRKTALGG